MDDGRKAEYLDTIVAAIRESDRYFGYSSINITERFQIVAKYDRIKDKRKNLLYVLAILMLCFSYSFVIQSEFEAPLEDIETDDNTYSAESSETYVLTDGNDNYWLIFPDVEKAVIDELTAIKLVKEGFLLREE